MIENHFRAYMKKLDEIRDKNMELIKLKEDWYNLTGTNYDDIKVSGGKRIDIADQLHNIVEKEKELKFIIEYKDELRRVHEKEINKLDKSNERTVLKLFYLDGCSIKQIAYCLRVSEGHAKKLKRWAINDFIEKVIKEGD